MAFEYLTNITVEQKIAARQAASEERDRIIQQAINNGARVQYLSFKPSPEEEETHIYTDITGECIVDTTIPSDITKFIKRGWEITGVTYFKETNQVIGITCRGKSKNISIRNVE